jgi:hypothetical protein
VKDGVEASRLTSVRCKFNSTKSARNIHIIVITSRRSVHGKMPIGASQSYSTLADISRKRANKVA